MSDKRRRYTPDFKAKIAAEALRGMKTQNEIATEHGIHPLQVTQWKKQMLAGLPSLFGSKPDRNLAEQDALIAQLYQQIGQLKVEVDFLKKNADRLLR